MSWPPKAQMTWMHGRVSRCSQPVAGYASDDVTMRRRWELMIDGTVVKSRRSGKDAAGTRSDASPDVEVFTSTAAAQLLWYSPGVVEWFRISDS
ncbi:hypothetical protein BJ912DRAFT_175029 [Pholiota molesta]|nr:hypothetical protein BJ912DRAFT_175029 [Pholiota molesta]